MSKSSTGYSLKEYCQMFADTPRMEAYFQALKKFITPESVVVDIGSGPGIFSLLACELGAKKVYAIEPDISILPAQNLARLNGYGDRIECIRDISTQIELHEQADIIISDLRGVLPLFEQHIPSIIDARERFLAPGGNMIPQSDSLWISVMESPDQYECCVTPWQGNDYGLDLSSLKHLLENTLHKIRPPEGSLLAEPTHLYKIDYKTVTHSGFQQKRVLNIQRDGVGHGLMIWFDCTTCDGEHFSNSPNMDELVYGVGYLPWTEAVKFVAGDQLTVDIGSHLIESNYIWTWQTQLPTSNHSGEKTFSQTSFNGEILDIDRLRKTKDNYIPKLTDSGEAELMVLNQIKQTFPLGHIAHNLQHDFPDQFPSYTKALSYVGDLSTRFSA
ncbi:MAG: 50S ribosomal protein L11 methyltransferase [Arenicellales bacterium]